MLKWEICTAKDLEQEKGRLSLCFVVPYSACGYSKTGVDFQSNSDIYRNYSAGVLPIMEWPAQSLALNYSSVMGTEKLPECQRAARLQN